MVFSYKRGQDEQHILDMEEQNRVPRHNTDDDVRTINTARLSEGTDVADHRGIYLDKDADNSRTDVASSIYGGRPDSRGYPDEKSQGRYGGLPGVVMNPYSPIGTDNSPYASPVEGGRRGDSADWPGPYSSGGPPKGASPYGGGPPAGAGGRPGGPLGGPPGGAGGPPGGKPGGGPPGGGPPGGRPGGGPPGGGPPGGRPGGGPPGNFEGEKMSKGYIALIMSALLVRRSTTSRSVG